MTSSNAHNKTTDSGRMRIQAEERNNFPPATSNVDDISDGESVISGKHPHIETSPDPESDWDNDDDPALLVARRLRLAGKALEAMENEYPILMEFEEDILEYAGKSLFEQEVLRYAQVLFTNRLLRASLSTEDTTYSISQELSANVNVYVWKLALSPFLLSYRQPWAPTVLAAMQDDNVNDLPHPANVYHVNIFTSKVNDAAAKARYHIKGVLEQSLGILRRKKKDTSTPDPPKRHITAVALDLSTRGDCIITEEFLQRLAVLRAICCTYHADSVTASFWSYVDEKLHEYLWPHETLELDMMNYPGAPKVLPDYSGVVIPTDTVPEMQKMMDKRARRM